MKRWIPTIAYALFTLAVFTALFGGLALLRRGPPAPPPAVPTTPYQKAAARALGNYCTYLFREEGDRVTVVYSAYAGSPDYPRVAHFRIYDQGHGILTAALTDPD
jgi:hypothetical protein